MRQKGFMNRKLFTLSYALKVSYFVMSRNYFTAKKLSRKHGKQITSSADDFSQEQVSSILLYIKSSPPSYFTALYNLTFRLFILFQ